MFIFRRLKINYESHEFILDSGTVANSTYVLYNKLHFTFSSVTESSRDGGGGTRSAEPRWLFAISADGASCSQATVTTVTTMTTITSHAIISGGGERKANVGSIVKRVKKVRTNEGWVRNLKM